MKEYIERAAVLKVLEEYYPGADERLHIVKDITSIPAADVAEVRHGRWELYGNDDDLGSSYFCSVCHSSRLFQIMCKPPEWCKIEALHRRLYIWPEKIARRKKKPGGKKSANCCRWRTSAAWKTSRAYLKRP